MTRRAGLLNMNKPAGITSRRVVDAVQRLVRPDKAGHAGTLDPMATGVLVVCVGPATRLIPFVQEQRKTYRATFQLGLRSDTDDVTGTLVPTENCEPVDRAALDAALPRFVGRIEQVPPKFSAVHVEGKRAYDLARRGEAVDLAAKPVDVYRIDVLGYDWPRLDVEIECGSGTYVRSIGRDLGETLGCGAAMSGLVRTRIGPFAIEDAVDLDSLDLPRLDASLHPMLRAVECLPRRMCEAGEARALSQGKAIPADDAAALPDGTLFACVAPDGWVSYLDPASPPTAPSRPSHRSTGRAPRSGQESSCSERIRASPQAPSECGAARRRASRS